MVEPLNQFAGPSDLAGCWKPAFERPHEPFDPTGKRCGDVQAGFPLPGVGINAPAKLEDIGMGAVGGSADFLHIKTLFQP